MWRRRGPGQPGRRKTYSAQSGYAYEYFFTGMTERGYRFEVSSTRRGMNEVFVEIDRGELTRAASRELSAVEEYAVAKLSLLQAFDEREPDSLGLTVRPTCEDFRSILTTLDLL